MQLGTTFWGDVKFNELFEKVYREEEESEERKWGENEGREVKEARPFMVISYPRFLV